ncbi:hypothetical protein GCM10010250_45260 [Streptomyces althioticus]|uniref:hypothetical protein n=1 Tax=Streptomyces althioticus TaxID=83380 RepID=UPI001876F188|nr:hypothetical protein GCM10010250_45260 [Streptomyces althioticus]
MTGDGRPVEEFTAELLAREVFGPLGGVVEIGAVNATGTWRLADVSLGDFLHGRRAEVDVLLARLRSACAFDSTAMSIAWDLGWLRPHDVTAASLLLWSGGLTGVPDDPAELESPAVVRHMCQVGADLQLTRLLHASVTAAVTAGTEAKRGARTGGRTDGGLRPLGWATPVGRSASVAGRPPRARPPPRLGRVGRRPLGLPGVRTRPDGDLRRLTGPRPTR